MGRKYGITKNGMTGLFPCDAREGDQVCVVLSVAVPFVIRKVSGAQDYYTLVGECCLDGLMGEGALMRDSSRVKDLTFV